ncbi:hypothetical protein AC579_6176 [Pseudocercospora musae]|uniref:Uncharacterized protein n=1 Tax=Pseudocercospora musae TaxID=113226 RepID=A0A139IS33_9PEZI|nr:hypothetical protein AC579_6176 [Pseudocercospora musae]
MFIYDTRVTSAATARFAPLEDEPIATTVENAPLSGTPAPAVYRYASGGQTCKTFVAGRDVHEEAGLSMSPDMNRDLVWSDEAELIQYVNSTGTLETIDGASSSWDCSHNTGIAFEAANETPFASICAEDQGAIWLNTNGQGMYSNGVKVSNENTTNGAGGEAMGGLSGLYSGLARCSNSPSYIFAGAHEVPPLILSRISGWAKARPTAKTARTDAVWPSSRW